MFPESNQADVYFISPAYAKLESVTNNAATVSVCSSGRETWGLFCMGVVAAATSDETGASIKSTHLTPLREGTQLLRNHTHMWGNGRQSSYVLSHFTSVWRGGSMRAQLSCRHEKYDDIRQNSFWFSHTHTIDMYIWNIYIFAYFIFAFKTFNYEKFLFFYI